ncbi:hypothetical protein Clacol_002784 [Clathrus columnatus]|uniref:Uncharacterized protein n=1 Tax=Clathrus columnatus TaxID=1419009 RepID=A0AAV5A2U0_9AGAM|nr:hypothetical protein Clacol_002784 [Clathrus columnatus]
MVILQTGTSDIPLTANGEALIERLGSKAVGSGKFIDPNLLGKVLVSPRIRAQRTCQILFTNTDIKPTIETEQLVREWTYGDYEGLYLHEIVEQRQAHGLQPEHTDWNIWIDGCEGGESAQDLTNRADAVIDQVKNFHNEWIHKSGRNLDDQGGDILVICVLEYSKEMKSTRLGAMNLGLL